MKMRFNANHLKVLAVIVMTLDHAALLFLSPEQPIYFLMRFFGRWTAPVMSFFLAEGFTHTRNFRNYLRRMLLFAILSQPFYFVLIFRRTPESTAEFLTHLNVLFTMSISLIMLKLISVPKWKLQTKVIAVVICCMLSDLCDWSYLIPIWVLIFYLFREKIKQRTLIFLIVSAVMLVQRYLPSYDSFADFSYQLGVLTAIVPISLYNGQRGRLRYKMFERYAFYVYYPLHIAGLELLFRNCCMQHNI